MPKVHYARCNKIVYITNLLFYHQLKEEIAEYKEDVEQLKEIAKKSDVKIKVRESAAAKRLLKKVDAMISKLDKVMDGLEKEKKLQADGQKPSEELVHIDEVMNAVRKVN